MILAAGELLLLNTLNFWEDHQLNGPFKATRDLDLQEVLHDYLRSIEGIANERDLTLHSRNLKLEVDAAGYQKHAQADVDHIGDGFVAWLVKEGLVEPVRALSFAVRIEVDAKAGAVVHATLSGTMDAAEISARSDDLPQVLPATSP